MATEPRNGEKGRKGEREKGRKGENKKGTHVEQRICRREGDEEGTEMRAGFGFVSFFFQLNEGRKDEGLSDAGKRQSARRAAHGARRTARGARRTAQKAQKAQQAVTYAPDM